MIAGTALSTLFTAIELRNRAPHDPEANDRLLEALRAWGHEITPVGIDLLFYLNGDRPGAKAPYITMIAETQLRPRPPYAHGRYNNTKTLSDGFFMTVEMARRREGDGAAAKMMTGLYMDLAVELIRGVAVFRRGVDDAHITE